MILFDGECHLCSRSVGFILKRDRGKVFRFGSLQSEQGRRLLAARGMDPGRADSVVLVEPDRVSVRSAAALRIVKRLRFPWPLLAVFAVIPRPLRDALYDWIARRRFDWFGRRESCYTPGDDVRDRFLDSRPGRGALPRPPDTT